MRPIKQMDTIRPFATAFITATVLTACGGDSGNSSSGSDPSTSDIEANSRDAPDFITAARELPISIDSETAEKLVATVFRSLDRAGNLGDQDTPDGALADRDWLGGDEFGFKTFSLDQLADSSIWDVQGWGNGDSPIECPLSGSFFIEIVTSGGPELQLGDKIISASDDCRLTQTVSVDGRFEVEVSHIAGSPVTDPNSAYELVLDNDVQHFQVTMPEHAFQADGNIRIEQTLTDTTQTSTISSSTGFSAASHDDYIKIENFALTWALELPTQVASFTVNGVLLLKNSLGDIDGSLTLTTILAFKGAMGEPPSEGSLLIEGANHSATIVQATTNGGLLIEIDADGDGLFEETIDTSWAELKDTLPSPW